MSPATVKIPYAWRRVTVRGFFLDFDSLLVGRHHFYRTLFTDGTSLREQDQSGAWKAPVRLRDRWPHADAIEVDMTGDAWECDS